MKELKDQIIHSNRRGNLELQMVFQSQGMYLFLELIRQELILKRQIHFYTILLIYQIMLIYQDVTWKLQMETNIQIFTLNLLQICQEFLEM